MNFSSGRRNKARATLDITPLIDVIFNLLIFLLITTTFVQNPALDVDLPKAQTAPEQLLTENIVIAIRADGQLVHEGAPLAPASLGTRLRELYALRADAMVIIRADTATAHGRVVEVMDLARQVGFAKLAIATEKRDGSLAGPGSGSQIVDSPRRPR